jgi:hypothetical protein
MPYQVVRRITVTLFFTAFAATAGAASIGVNYTGGGNNSSPAVSLASTDAAGVVPQTNYNNFAGGSGTALALIDSAGAASGATLTYGSGGTYSSIGGAAIAPADGNEKLNTGFIFGNATVTVSGVPYSRYDVYVYMLNDAAGRVETTSLTAGGPAQTFYGGSAAANDAGHVDQNAATPYVYTRTISTDVAVPTTAGDYVLFSGLTTPSFQFTTAATGNGYLNGFQIVQNVPEPAALGFLGLASLAALTCRRRVRGGRVAD